MAPTDYSSVYIKKAPLRFKGDRVEKPKKKKKSKKPHDKHADDAGPAGEKKPNATDDDPDKQPQDVSAERKGDEEGGRRRRRREKSPVNYAPSKTQAELEFEERRRQRLEEQIRKGGMPTHRENVEKFNASLAKLSEHHDMPRIGPG